MKKKRTTITYGQVYDLKETIKEKYRANPPDKYVKYIAENLSQELRFQVSAHAVAAAFDYFNIPRKGHRGAPGCDTSSKDHTIDLLRNQIAVLESKIATLKGAI